MTCDTGRDHFGFQCNRCGQKHTIVLPPLPGIAMSPVADVDHSSAQNLAIRIATTSASDSPTRMLLDSWSVEVAGLLAQLSAVQAEHEKKDEAVRLAFEVLNTWGVFARRGKEQDVIASLRERVAALHSRDAQETTS